MVHGSIEGRCVRPVALGPLLPVLLFLPFFSFGCGSDSHRTEPVQEAAEFMAGDTLVKLMGGPVHPGAARLEAEVTIGVADGPEVALLRWRIAVGGRRGSWDEFSSC
jgi:hypothetical protein